MNWYRPLELDPIRGKRLIILSFHLSQCDPTLHYELLDWLAFSFPQYKVSTELSEKVYELSLPAVQAISSSGNSNPKYLHGPNSYSSEQNAVYLRHFVKYFQQAFTSRFPRPGSLDTIAVYMLRSEEKRLLELGGRKRMPSNSRGLFADPFVSYVCHYGLIEHSTGLAEYDFLMKRVARRLMYPDLSERFRAVITFHAHHHPGDVATLRKFIPTL